jgi:hypothetical protein
MTGKKKLKRFGPYRWFGHPRGLKPFFFIFLFFLPWGGRTTPYGAQGWFDHPNGQNLDFLFFSAMGWFGYPRPVSHPTSFSFQFFFKILIIF